MVLLGYFGIHPEVLADLGRFEGPTHRLGLTARAQGLDVNHVGLSTEQMAKCGL